jgi:hypothetical protein
MQGVSYTGLIHFLRVPFIVQLCEQKAEKWNHFLLVKMAKQLRL